MRQSLAKLHEKGLKHTLMLANLQCMLAVGKLILVQVEDERRKAKGVKFEQCRRKNGKGL